MVGELDHHLHVLSRVVFGIEVRVEPFWVFRGHADLLIHHQRLPGWYGVAPPTRLLASDTMTATSDVLDEHGDRAAVCSIAFRQFGGRRAFEGPISTVRCDEDNVLVRRRLSEPGGGGVLVVDGGGSLAGGPRR